MFRMHGGMSNELEVLTPRSGPPRLGVGLAILGLALSALLVALVVVVTFSAFGDSDANAFLHVDTSVTGVSVTVSGSTNLPEGALISVEVQNMDVDGRAYGQATVHDGRYTTTVSVDPIYWDKGLVIATARFEPFAVGQVPAARERFGSHGERLRSPDVIVNAIGDRYLSVTVRVTAPGS